MSYKNIEDHKAYQKKYQKEWYKKNRKKHIKNASQARARHVKETYQYTNAFKEQQGCTNCKENHIACLEFHHKDASIKEFEISWAIKAGYGLERIKKEISKCIVLCSNCHKKLHWQERELKKRKLV